MATLNPGIRVDNINSISISYVITQADAEQINVCFENHSQYDCLTKVDCFNLMAEDIQEPNIKKLCHAILNAMKGCPRFKFFLFS